MQSFQSPPRVKTFEVNYLDAIYECILREEGGGMQHWLHGARNIGRFLNLTTERKQRWEFGCLYYYIFIYIHTNIQFSHPYIKDTVVGASSLERESNDKSIDLGGSFIFFFFVHLDLF